MRTIPILILAAGVALAGPSKMLKFKKSEEPSPLDKLILQDGTSATLGGPEAAPGSTFRQGARLADMIRDARALQRNDLVTIVVSDRASAVTKGVTNTARKSSTKNTFGGLLGQIKTGSPLANPLQMSGDTQIQGTGETNRSNTLTTTLTGRVTHVLANGLLVVEGTKTIEVNSERQLVTVRGLARPTDVGPANQVISDRLAMLEIKVNGRGVVGDAIRRPFFLYRLLLGFLAL